MNRPLRRPKCRVSLLMKYNLACNSLTSISDYYNRKENEPSTDVNLAEVVVEGFVERNSTLKTKTNSKKFNKLTSHTPDTGSDIRPAWLVSQLNSNEC